MCFLIERLRKAHLNRILGCNKQLSDWTAEPLCTLHRIEQYLNFCYTTYLITDCAGCQVGSTYLLSVTTPPSSATELREQVKLNPSID